LERDALREKEEGKRKRKGREGCRIPSDLRFLLRSERGERKNSKRSATILWKGE